MACFVRKHDTVVVLTGRDKGKQGPVISIDPKKGKLLVKGVALVVKHAKARRQGEVSEIKRRESFIDISNVMIVCATCKKSSRPSSKLLETGDKVRICHRCKEIM